MESSPQATISAALKALADMPADMGRAFRASGGTGEPASAAIVRPWAVRAAKTKPLSHDAKAVLEGAVQTLSDRYAYLGRQFKKASGKELKKLPTVIGQAGQVTLAVAEVIWSAWDVLVAGTVAAAKWAVQNPLKTLAAAGAAAALPGVISAGKNLGKSASGVTAALVPDGSGAGFLGGLGLPVLLLLIFLALRK